MNCDSETIFTEAGRCSIDYIKSFITQHVNTHKASCRLASLGSALISKQCRYCDRPSVTESVLLRPVEAMWFAFEIETTRGGVIFIRGTITLPVRSTPTG